MSPVELDLTPQLVIVARLAEFCGFRAAQRFASDPWDFMLRKLQEIEAPLASLKINLFEIVREEILAELARGPLSPERACDYKLRLQSLLSPGDFADAAIHLDDGSPAAAGALRRLLAQLQPADFLARERRPDEPRSPAWDRLVEELYGRLDLPRLALVLERKPRTARRKAMVLRRMRVNMSEYCCVVRIPTDPGSSLTPFILPRLEAAVSANLRFLRRYR